MPGTQTRMQKRQQTIRGLATLAVLKANYDAGRDHIGMFEPLLSDTMAALDRDDCLVEEVRTAFLDRHGLLIPRPTLQTLLNRLKRRGVVRLEGGRYFRIPDRLRDADISESKTRATREHAKLARDLCEFAAKNRMPIDSEEDALLLLVAFLGEHQLPMLFDQPQALAVLPESPLSSKQERMVARFIRDHCLKDPEIADYLQHMLEGYVLQNALLLRDISSAARRFQDLTVYFDTGFLLGALGLEGEPNALIYKEVLGLLKTAGARLGVFEKTIEEIRTILRVYERCLTTHERRMSLHPTAVTRHFLTNHYQPSDVRQVIALLERNIKELGLTIAAFPSHEKSYTLNEKALSERLAAPHESLLEPRVVHDADCVAAVLTLPS